jgi:3-oxoadipate enol-lactonase
VSLQHRFDGPDRAPTLVLANSLATTLELWDDNVAALASRYWILRYDQRGHGRSPVPTGPYRVEDLAEDALELLDELGLERVSFCGLSLGGAVGIALALRAPERLERLILCCTSAQFAPPEKWVERARTARGEGLEPLVDATLERWFTPAFRAARPEAVARLRDQFLATPREGYAACCDALAAWDAREQIASIAVPTLAIAAADDPSTPPEHLEAIAAAIPGTELIVVPDAAHIVNIAQPEAFASAILSHALLEEAG